MVVSLERAAERKDLGMCLVLPTLKSYDILFFLEAHCTERLSPETLRVPNLRKLFPRDHARLYLVSRKVSSRKVGLARSLVLTKTPPIETLRDPTLLFSGGKGVFLCFCALEKNLDTLSVLKILLYLSIYL